MEVGSQRQYLLDGELFYITSAIFVLFVCQQEGSKQFKIAFIHLETLGTVVILQLSSKRSVVRLGKKLLFWFLDYLLEHFL